MLFNSYSFLLAYLPVTLLGYFLVGRLGKLAGATWLAACSLFFYAWWDYRYVLLLLASICGNFLISRVITAHAGKKVGKRALVIAIAANLLLLAYYKYADFFLESGNALLGSEWPLLRIILPIGISFFTFTQIAFLADSYAGKVTECRFIYYVLFVTYFPHLIAGPVLHHKEMMPQFDDAENCKPSASNLSIGLTIFAIGLAKKVLIADNLAGFAAPVFAADAAAPTLFLTWSGALAYTFQLYFDFSGYSDMAVGLSRLFGVRLPLNFSSPYKSQNIAQFWRRWHMTLSRFLRDYLYIPLGGNRHGEARRQFNLFTTMVLGGLWHGAGWNFVVWGALHGSYLVVHQLWTRQMANRLSWLPARLGRFFAIAFTFVCVVFAWVYFRSPDIVTANRVVAGMVGHWGAVLPESILVRFSLFKTIADMLGIGSYLGGGGVFVETWCWLLVAAAIAFLLPNTNQMMRYFEPPSADETSATPYPRAAFAWAPTRPFAIATGALAALGFLALSRPTEFLYFQF